MKKITLVDIKLFLIILSVLFLYAFSNHRNNNRFLKADPIVKFAGDSQHLFITHQQVNNLLIQKLGQTSTVLKERLDLNKIERVFDLHKMIEKAQVYTKVDGQLHLEIKQKTPIARVIQDQTHYYLDNNGNSMPLSTNYSAHLPLIKGIWNGKLKADYFEIIKLISEDTFLNNHITGILIQPDGKIQMTNRLFDYKIKLGHPNNFKSKIACYKAFLNHAYKSDKIKSYQTVNITFDNHVVCQ